MMMSDGAKIKLRMDAFNASMRKLQQNSKRKGEDFVKEQVRGFLRYVVNFTPPNRSKVIGSKAKQSGDKAIVSDVRSLFVASRKAATADVQTIDQMKGVMKQYRKSGGLRIRRNLDKKYKAPRNLIAELIRQKKSRVGYLSSAWVMAARSIGKMTVPSWIGRHNAPGSTRMVTRNENITATVENAVTWASEVWKLRPRVAAALSAQTNAMNRRLASYLSELKNKSDFK